MTNKTMSSEFSVRDGRTIKFQPNIFGTKIAGRKNDKTTEKCE